MQSGQTLCKYGDCSNQQSNKIMPTGPSYSDNREDHSDNFQYDPSDSDSSEDHSQNSEQHNDKCHLNCPIVTVVNHRIMKCSRFYHQL